MLLLSYPHTHQLVVLTAQGHVIWEPGPDRIQVIEASKSFQCSWCARAMSALTLHDNNVRVTMNRVLSLGDDQEASNVKTKLFMRVTWWASPLTARPPPLHTQGRDGDHRQRSHPPSQPPAGCCPPVALPATASSGSPQSVDRTGPRVTGVGWRDYS